jgi:hypothetical protein
LDEVRKHIGWKPIREVPLGETGTDGKRATILKLILKKQVVKIKLD